MTKEKGLKQKSNEGRKYQVCPKCGLDIRSPKHDEGWSHNNKGYQYRR